MGKNIYYDNEFTLKDDLDGTPIGRMVLLWLPQGKEF